MTAVRPDRRVSTIIACTAVAVTAFAGINVFHAFGPIHLHNDGPLVLGAAGITFDAGSTGPSTIGYQPCVNQGTDPVILEGIAPVSATGDGLQFLGAFTRLIPADTGGAIGSEAGFPPHVLQVLQPVAGFAVTQQCNFNSDTPPVPTSTSEIDVGVGKPVGSTGGGWPGYAVTYRVGSTQYVVTLDGPVYICGPTAPAAAQCNHP
ncbi:MAG: hypothetical protein WCB51_02530 [Candidatus Dormiibacterota bacterium]